MSTSIAPEPSASRGDVTLQPSYFTSSLYVTPLRQDFKNLVALFSEQYADTDQPFALFKKLWVEEGWCWLHLRVFDGRGRQAFLQNTERVFVEHLAATESLITRALALFALHTFHSTQPSVSAPPMYAVTHVAIPIDIYQSMVALPADLQGSDVLRLQPYVVRILMSLQESQTFHIIPRSSLRAQNPSILPRELFVPEGQDISTISQTALGEGEQQNGAPVKKKKGRPSKRDKARKAKEALTSLDKYLHKNAVYIIDEGAATSTADDGTTILEPESAHTVLGQAPHISLDNYVYRKNALLAGLYHDMPIQTDTTGSQTALHRANEAVLTRLREIDAMAAEKGMEIGGEGGEQTGLVRVERAVDELRQQRGPGANSGILGLLGGSGMG